MGRLFASIVILSVAATFPLSLWGGERTTISLSGIWDIEDSKEPEAIPAAWNNKAPVPGLAHSAQPAFPQIDQFDSRQVILNRVRDGKLPKSAIVYNAGVSRPERNWFWYRRTFEVSATSSVETRFSSRAIESDYSAHLHRAAPTKLSLGQAGQPPSTEAIFRAAAEGDESARCVIDRALEYLTGAVVSVLHVFDPEVLIIGGKIAEAGPQLLAPIRDEVAHRTRILLGREIPIVFQSLVRWVHDCARSLDRYVHGVHSPIALIGRANAFVNV